MGWPRFALHCSGRAQRVSRWRRPRSRTAEGARVEPPSAGPPGPTPPAAPVLVRPGLAPAAAKAPGAAGPNSGPPVTAVKAGDSAAYGRARRLPSWTFPTGRPNASAHPDRFSTGREFATRRPGARAARFPRRTRWVRTNSSFRVVVGSRTRIAGISMSGHTSSTPPLKNPSWSGCGGGFTNCSPVGRSRRRGFTRTSTACPRATICCASGW